MAQRCRWHFARSLIQSLRRPDFRDDYTRVTELLRAEKKAHSSSARLRQASAAWRN